MIALLFLMCGVCGWAFLAARRAGINGWITRYLLMMCVHSLAVTLPLLFISPDNHAYGILYVAALIPLLAVICVVALGWFWNLDAADRWVVGAWCGLQAAFTCTALTARAASVWSAGVPWQVTLLIVQFGILSCAGIMALAAKSELEPIYRPIANLLGTMWCMQALEKALFSAGFAYHWQTWLELNQWLPSAIVITGMTGLLFKFKAFEFWSHVAAVRAK